MCEAFEKLAKKYADQVADQVGDARAVQTRVDMVKSLMENMKWTLEQALTASGIKGKDRAVIAKALKN